MKRLLPLLLIALLFACKTDDPQARQIVGRWLVTKTESDGKTYVYTNSRSSVEFRPDGTAMPGEQYAVAGNYCQPLTNYSVKSKTITFQYSDEARCVYFVYPGPSIMQATLQTVTDSTLVFKHGARTIYHKRIM